MSSIEGIPEGWELVRVGKLMLGDYWLNSDGLVERWGLHHQSAAVNYIIIRKIERPKQYRAFANAAEYLPHWGKPVASKADYGFDSIVSTSHFCVYVGTAEKVQAYSMEEAFDKLNFADGTPFGVEVTE